VDDEEDSTGDALGLAVRVVVVTVEVDKVSFGLAEPDVRLLMTKPAGTGNDFLLPCVAVSQVPSDEFPVPQQKSNTVTGNISSPPPLETCERSTKCQRIGT